DSVGWGILVTCSRIVGSFGAWLFVQNPTSSWAFHPIEGDAPPRQNKIDKNVSYAFMNTRARFPELDLLRFLAACAVMLFHYTYLGPHNQSWRGSFPLLAQIFKYGYLG